MEATYDPFAILQVEPGVSLEEARASYRKLARQHHPDVVPECERESATKLMAALNEAVSALERDFEGWSQRLTAPTTQAYPVAGGVLSVEPRFVILSEAKGFEAFVTAAAPSGDGRGITLRYREGLIVVKRLRVGGRGVANFRVRVSPKVRALDLPERVEVELVAPGYLPVKITVAIEPFGARMDEEMRAASRSTSWWQRIRGIG